MLISELKGRSRSRFRRVSECSAHVSFAMRVESGATDVDASEASSGEGEEGDNVVRMRAIWHAFAPKSRTWSKSRLIS